MSPASIQYSEGHVVDRRLQPINRCYVVRIKGAGPIDARTDRRLLDFANVYNEDGRDEICVDHGPDCTNEGHVIGVEAWRALHGLCGLCGEEGDVPWGDPNRPHVLRCSRCALTQQLEHARERAAAIPQLEAELAVLA
jgi:hypothetical protein